MKHLNTTFLKACFRLPTITLVQSCQAEFQKFNFKNIKLKFFNAKISFPCICMHDNNHDDGRVMTMRAMETNVPVKAER
jgi:hypothetical protein